MYLVIDTSEFSPDLGCTDGCAGGYTRAMFSAKRAGWGSVILVPSHRALLKMKLCEHTSTLGTIIRLSRSAHLGPP
jgi:hypothetical protein